MTPRISSSAVVVAALFACKNSGPADPEPGMPDAEVVAAFDPGALADRPGAPPQVAAGAPLAVVDYAPQGRTAGGAAIKVRFNQPVVALGSEEVPDPSRFLAFEPPLPGQARFLGPDLLQFIPSESLAEATQYKVRFAPGFTALDGQQLAQGVEWTFETPRPRCEGASPLRDGGLEDLRRDAPFLVAFDQPTRLAEARAHLKAAARPLADPDARPAPVGLQIREATAAEIRRIHDSYDRDYDRGRYYTVRPQGLWPGDSEIQLSVTPGLVGTLGSLPLDTPWEMSFQTYGPQSVVDFGCGEGETRCGLQPIYLTLRNPVREAQAKQISVHPRPKSLTIEVFDAHGDEGGTNVSIEGQFVPGTTYTVSVAPGLKDIFGQTLGGGFTRTFVTERRPELTLASADGTLIPARKQTIGIEARFVKSLRVRAAVVSEADLIKASYKAGAMPAGAHARTIALEPKGAGGWASIALDVGELVGGARGPVVVEVAAEEVMPAVSGDAPPTVRGLYRLTDLGPVVIDSPSRAVVQVLRLSDSTPVVGATVTRALVKDGAVTTRALGVTDGDGLLVLPPVSEYMSRGLVQAGDGAQAQRLIVADPATRDSTIIAAGEVPDAGALAADLRPGERLIARVVADRGAYRPGEAVKVVGWAAVETPHAASGLKHLAKKTEVKFTLADPTGAEVATKTVHTTGEGKFWAELALPGEARLGRYKVRATLPGGEASETVKVEDFRVPEFQVTASVKRPDILAGQAAGLRVATNYYFGGAVPIEALAYQSSCTPHRYRPPGLDSSWVVGAPLADGVRVYATARRHAGAEPSARPGLRELEVPLALVAEEHPHRCTISAEVRDASNQAIGAEAQVQVHPADLYLALGLPPGGRRAGDRVGLPVRAVDLAGARVAAKGAKLLVERTWSEVQERAEAGRMVFDGWVEKSEKVKTCNLDVPAAGDEPRCELPALKEGSYEVSVELTTADARRVRTVGDFWVAPATRQQRWVPQPQPKRLTIETSVASVSPGEPVDVAVYAPWQTARGILVLDRKGLREVKPFTVAGGNPANFRFTADDTWTPQVHVRAFMVAPIDAKDRPLRPEVVSTRATIEQGAEHRRLQVRVEAPPKAGPGERVELAAFVRDDAGQPVAARVALWAVDEAVLALTDYEVPDLLPSFLPGGDVGSSAYDDYARVMWPYTPILADPWLSGTWGYGRGYGSGRGSRTAHMRGASPMVQGAPAARERFETTPVFLADLATGAGGEARVKATLPENLTTFRIFALASARLVDKTSPGRFGLGDARTTVSTPFIVRAATPRQLRPGDAAEVAAIVQNFTEVAGRAAVELVLHDDPSTKGQDLVAMSKRTADVEVPAGGQVRVPFTIRADAAGEAKLELRAVLRADGVKAGGDAIKLALPVEPERTLTEKVAMYGSLADDRAIAIPVVMPGAVRRDVGGVSVSASSSLLGGLEDAVDALLTYPHGCVEQTSSRLLPVVSLAALHATYPLGLREDPKLFVKAGVERILAMQTSSGGFAYWPGGQVVHPYASAYATWVLGLAARAGHPVPEVALTRALEDLEQRLGAPGEQQSRWGGADLVRHALALHVLADADRHKREQLDALYLRRAELPAFGRAFLLMAMHRGDPLRPEVAALTSELLADLEELPATAHVIERADWGVVDFHSDGRSDAIVLAALLRVRPEHAVIEKLARGLLERRIGGAWRNTQENAYALVAIADYARVREAEPPDFVGRAWVGARPVFEASFLGRDLKAQEATAKMPDILRPASGEATAASTPLTVVLQRRGQGRMYYRLGAEWAPAEPEPPAREHGLDVGRALRLADGALGQRAITIGDAVAVDLELTSRTRIRYVALEVPLPAGLEAVQLDLGKGQAAAKLSGSRGWWVSHEELRRDRVVVFADDLPPGTHHHTVFLRATSRGDYQLPPAHAEAMYMPEVWGRSAGARVAVR